MINIMYIFLQKKSNPEIVNYSSKRESIHLLEYLEKIKFYLPLMNKFFYEKLNPEKFPKRSMYIFNSPCVMCDYISLCDETYNDEFTIYETTYEKPIITPTDLISFETCPRAWAYRKSGIYPVKKKATIEAGTCIHKAIELFLLENKNPVQVFQEEWDNTVQNYTMDFNKKESPELLKEIGSILMEKFPDYWKNLNFDVLSVEERISIDFGDFTFSGKWDLLCKDKDNNEVIIDFKFSTPHNEDTVVKWLNKSDQVTGYALLKLCKNPSFFEEIKSKLKK